MADGPDSIWLSGRRFTADEIALVCETVASCSGLSWHELLQTVCEHLGWVTPTGRYKVASCAQALVWLARTGLVSLPRRVPCRGRPEAVVIGPETDAEAAVRGTVRTIAPRRGDPGDGGGGAAALERVRGALSPAGVSAAVRSTPAVFRGGGGGAAAGVCFVCRVGVGAEGAGSVDWLERARSSGATHLVVANTRFILFPWVQVKNLASTVLSLVVKRVGTDCTRGMGMRRCCWRRSLTRRTTGGPATRRRTGSGWGSRRAAGGWTAARNICLRRGRFTYIR
jgi:hypothetical protein